MGLGAKFRARSFQNYAQGATAPSGQSPEVIWHEFYDSQAYLSAATTRLLFYSVTNVDPTISNMQSAGQLQDPYWFLMHDVCFDFLPITSYVSTINAANTGNLNNMGLLMMTARPIWTLTISDKRYGPYSLSALHGTGAIQGFLAGTGVALDHVEYGHNTVVAGWNYEGTLTIPPKIGFGFEVVWSAAQTMAVGNPTLRLAMFGVLARRVV